MKPRFYVGHIKGGKMVVFKATETPTEQSHGKQYFAVTGPFKTKRGAEFMAQHGFNNPHCVTVSEAEKLAKKYQGA